jgi:hypothetical protein
VRPYVSMTWCQIKLSFLHRQSSAERSLPAFLVSAVHMHVAAVASDDKSATD